MCINFSVLILQSTSVYNAFAVKCKNIQTFRWFVLENFRTALCDKECKVLSIGGSELLLTGRSRSVLRAHS